MFVRSDLGFDDLGQVDVEDIAQSQEIDRDISYLVAHTGGHGQIRRGAAVCGCVRLPLVLRDQFTDLGGESHDEVLRRVELLPVTLNDEGSQGCLQPYDGILAHAKELLVLKAQRDDVTQPAAVGEDNGQGVSGRCGGLD